MVNGCGNNVDISATVIDPSGVDAGPNHIFCIDVSPVDLNVFATPPGGTWSGVGLTGSTFDPSQGWSWKIITMTYSVGSGKLPGLQMT